MGAKLFARPASAGLRGVVVAVGALVASLAIVGAACATPITIDDFTLPQNPGATTVPPGTNMTTSYSQPIANVLGGQRNAQLSAIGTAFSLAAYGTFGTDNFGTPAARNQFHGGSVGTDTYPLYSLQYNAGGSSLINGTNDRIQLQFYTSDALPTVGLAIQITITSPSGTSTMSKDAPNSQLPFAVDFPFSQFSAGANFSNVTSVQIDFNNGVRHTSNVDFALKSITAVPEPASLFTMAVGGALCGVASLRRRKSRPSA